MTFSYSKFNVKTGRKSFRRVNYPWIGHIAPTIELRAIHKVLLNIQHDKIKQKLYRDYKDSYAFPRQTTVLSLRYQISVHGCGGVERCSAVQK